MGAARLPCVPSGRIPSSVSRGISIAVRESVQALLLRGAIPGVGRRISCKANRSGPLTSTACTGMLEPSRPLFLAGSEQVVR